MRKIYLLGGKGFIGSAFFDILSRRDCSIHVIDRLNYSTFLGSQCDLLINANGNSKKFLAAENPELEFEASVASVRRSLVDFKFEKYVYLSTCDVYPDSSSPATTSEDQVLAPENQSPYGFHKRLAELCVQHAAKDWLIIRQGGFVGPGMKKNAVFDVLHGDKLWVHPDSRFQFISTEDSARLVLELVDRSISKEIFNLTAAGTISVQEIMELAGSTVPHDEDARKVHCEINTDKVARLVSLPETFAGVAQFLGKS